MNKADRAIADQILANHIRLERFTAGERKKVLAVLLEMQKELKTKLQNGLTDYSKARMLKLLNDCTATINEYYSGIQSQLDLTGLAKHEAAATHKAIASIGLDASLPTNEVMKALVSDTLLSGAPLKSWWEKQADDVAFKFAAQVRQGIAQGETMQEIITRVVGNPKKGIAGIMDISRRHASALVHDSIMQVANNARMEVYKANEDIMNGYQHLSTLDSNTCVECAARDGLVWDLDHDPKGHSVPFQEPPIHVNCRCVLIPALKSYRELGVDIDEPKGERASDLGPVEDDLSFDAFLRRHDKEYQDELLGKGKAELWRSKKITLQDLLSQNGRELTLKELKEAA